MAKSVGMISFVAAVLFSGCCSAQTIFLLPSQDTPNFYNVRMCRDHKVVSGILTAAISILKTKVTVAGSDGPKTEHQPDDIRLEAVSILSDGKSAIFCSVTISANGITERVAYSVGPDNAPGSYGNSWVLKFGGDQRSVGGGNKLFPEMIQARPGEGRAWHVTQPAAPRAP
jgi:hypothetical protein